MTWPISLGRWYGRQLTARSSMFGSHTLSYTVMWSGWHQWMFECRQTPPPNFLPDRTVSLSVWCREKPSILTWDSGTISDIHVSKKHSRLVCPHKRSYVFSRADSSSDLFTNKRIFLMITDGSTGLKPCRLFLAWTPPLQPLFLHFVGATGNVMPTSGNASAEGRSWRSSSRL